MGTERSVLIIHHNDGLRLGIVHVLRGAGYDVFSPIDAAEALGLLFTLQRSPHPCVVIADFDLSALHGWAVARAIRRTPTFSSVRVLLMSAIVTPAAVDADAVLLKPFHIGDLCKTVAGLFAASAGSARDDQ